MPEELKSEEGFKTAVHNYQKKIVKEPYQPLSSLLNKLKTLCSYNSTQSQVLALPQ
ncbi:MAG: hypothetical protein WC917_04505 [Bacilli bacterium]|jgi:hypothetical protein